MRRTGISRKTPLTSNTQMRRTGPTRRSNPTTRQRARAADAGPELVVDEFGLTWEASPLDRDPLWSVARQVAARRDRYMCCRCGQPGVDVHHRLGRGMGGRMHDPDRHAPARLLTLCRACHQWAEADRDGKATADGYRIRAAEQATTVAVIMWHGVVMLRADGGMNTLRPRAAR